MRKPARPTLSCLNLLDEDWESSDDKRESHADNLDGIGKELHLLQHPLIRKAADDFPLEEGEAGDRKREGITDLKDPMWWKVKTGRWRGAAYEDDEGQVWLCAGGYRRGKESTDFYQWFMAQVNTHGPGPFLPTTEDRERLAGELAEEKFVSWEKQIQILARDVVSRAQLEGIVSSEVTDPDGDVMGSFVVGITEEALDGDLIGDLYFEYTCSDWNNYEVFSWAETVMCLAIESREQTWRPTNIRDGRAYSLVLDAAEMAAFFGGLERPMLGPGESVPGTESHWAHRGRLTEATVVGDAVKGLCGRWFVPRQDHESLPQCRECELVYGRMQG